MLVRVLYPPTFSITSCLSSSDAAWSDVNCSSSMVTTAKGKMGDSRLSVDLTAPPGWGVSSCHKGCSQLALVLSPMCVRPVSVLPCRRRMDSFGSDGAAGGRRRRHSDRHGHRHGHRYRGKEAHQSPVSTPHRFASQPLLPLTLRLDSVERGSTLRDRRAGLELEDNCRGVSARHTNPSTRQHTVALGHCGSDEGGDER